MLFLLGRSACAADDLGGALWLAAVGAMRTNPVALPGANFPREVVTATFPDENCGLLAALDPAWQALVPAKFTSRLKIQTRLRGWPSMARDFTKFIFMRRVEACCASRALTSMAQALLVANARRKSVP